MLTESGSHPPHKTAHAKPDAERRALTFREIMDRLLLACVVLIGGWVGNKLQTLTESVQALSLKMTEVTERLSSERDNRIRVEADLASLRQQLLDRERRP